MNKDSFQKCDSSDALDIPITMPAEKDVWPKQVVTIRLDIEVVKWFKSGGAGYQTRINKILREHIAGIKKNS